MAQVRGLLEGSGPIVMTLELTPREAPTEQSPGGGEIFAVAFLATERTPVPVQNQVVTFFCVGEQSVDETTGELGRAEHTFSGLGFGAHSISAKVAGLYVTARHTFAKPAETVRTVKVPTDLKVYAHPEGRAPVYYVTVEVSVAGEGGVKWPFEIKDVAHPDKGKRVVAEDTKPDGSYRFVVETDGPREIFTSMVGTPLDYTLKLPGPLSRRLSRPSKPPEIPLEVLQKGLWEALKWFDAEASKANAERRGAK